MTIGIPSREFWTMGGDAVEAPGCHLVTIGIPSFLDWPMACRGLILVLSERPEPIALLTLIHLSCNAFLFVLPVLTVGIISALSELRSAPSPSPPSSPRNSTTSATPNDWQRLKVASSPASLFSLNFVPLMLILFVVISDAKYYSAQASSTPWREELP